MRRLTALFAAVIGVTAVAACSSTSGSPSSPTNPSAASASCPATPGVTPNTINLGAMVSVSGVGGTFNGDTQAIEAAVKSQNAQGGIDGRKIVLSAVDDDAATPATNILDAKEMVSEAGVLGIVEFSSAIDASSAYLNSLSVPETGFSNNPDDMTYDNVFGFNGFQQAPTGTSYTHQLLFGLSAKYLYSKGHKLALLGVDIPSTPPIQATLTSWFKHFGGQVVLTESDIPFAQTDFTADVQRIKASGANVLELLMGSAGSISLLNALQQAGVHLNTVVVSGVYNRSFLTPTDPGLAGTTDPEDTVPFETNSPELKPYLSSMAKYSGISKTEYESQWVIAGWLSAQLMFYGIEHAGQCPTRAKVVKALNESTTWDGNGMLAKPINFGYLRKNKLTTSCSYFVVVNAAGSAWEPASGFAPACLSG